MRWHGAREAILKATAYGYRASGFVTDKIDGANTDGDTHIVTGLECGKVLAAVDSIGDPVTSWLYFCYGAEFNRRHYTTVWQALYADLFASVSEAKRRRHESVCRLSLNNYRWRVWGREPFSDVQMAIVLNVKRQHFRRDFGKKLDRCMRLIDNWERIGVGRVGASLDEGHGNVHA